MTALNLAELEAIARAQIPATSWDYYAGGAGDEATLRDNVEAYARLRLMPRVLVDVSKLTLATTALGAPIAFPVLVAPLACQRLAHADGEAATARGAAAAGTIMVVSTLATMRLEDVATAADAPKWFQLYVHKDHGLTRALIDRAVAAGYRAIVLTVDTPRLGRRERDVRNGFTLPRGLALANFTGDAARTPATTGGSGLAAYAASHLDDALTWDDLAWVRAQSSLPLAIKGVVRADDARRAVELGAAAVIVSNHGGRQLDGTIATIDALPAVADAVGGRAEVYVDGGVRRGTDVLKALALGARAVLLGRPVLWALAAGGAEGVTQALALLRAELDHALALAGVPSVRDVPRDVVR